MLVFKFRSDPGLKLNDVGATHPKWPPLFFNMLSPLNVMYCGIRLILFVSCLESSSTCCPCTFRRELKLSTFFTSRPNMFGVIAVDTIYKLLAYLFVITYCYCYYYYCCYYYYYYYSTNHHHYLSLHVCSRLVAVWFISLPGNVSF